MDAEEAADGYVLYDPERDRVHYLNHTAALVLEFCTGDNSPEEMVMMMQAGYDLPEPPEAEVRTCLEQLHKEGLIE